MQQLKDAARFFGRLFFVVVSEGAVVWKAIEAPAAAGDDLVRLVILAVCGVGALFFAALWAVWTRDMHEKLGRKIMVHLSATVILLWVGINCILYAGVRAFVSL